MSRPAKPFVEPIYRLLGDLIRLRRKESGLSIENLAHKTGLTITNIHEIERAKYRTSMHKLERVAQALETTGWELLREAEEGK